MMPTPRPQLHPGDCLDVLPTLADSSIDLIVTDPPYFRCKSEKWDRQWKTAADYLDWIGRLCGEWRRVLRPNGSLYCFASPRMAARVECRIGEHFEVLNSIVWAKPDPSSSINYGPGNGGRMCKDAMRAFYPNTERIIFAEQPGADSMALGESGYAARCEQLRGFVFEPLRAYLAGERDRAGFTTRRVAEAFQRKTGTRTVTGMAGHWFERVQWMLPTEANYGWLRGLFGRDYLRREYEGLRREYEGLRREYEGLRREYEGLRRPFAVSADVPYTDVWDFPTVSYRPGKHVCQKPVAMLEHMIAASSRPGATVLDCFMGSGSTGEAAAALGRSFVGIEADPGWFDAASRRLTAPTRLAATA